MRFLKDRRLGRRHNTRTVACSDIIETQCAVILPTNNTIVLTMVEHRSAQSTLWSESQLRLVGIIEVPDVTVKWHLVRHLLESQDRVADTHPGV